MQKAVVYWEGLPDSEYEGLSGHGEPVRITDADSWVQAMNWKYAGLIRHWYETVPKPTSHLPIESEGK